MNSSNQLSGAPIAQQQIKVYGIVGEFSVGTNNATSPYRVRYFNTIASSASDTRAGNSRELLKELKPMRERTRSAELNDLSALLQRELNDYRVAHDLIPYLRGEHAEVGFFPGILVALVPKKFLQGTTQTNYPAPQSETPQKINYEQYWALETYSIGEASTALGVLSIDPNKTDLIVLDGQHRANAFRYMAGSFPDATEDTIYSPFYQGCSVPDEYEAELPVTIVWFESKEKPISPVLISRRLFVDVNTNARPVQESRNILLDDHNLASIATTNVYASLAERSFTKNRISLLHSGFDVEENRAPRFALFSPALLKYCFSYFLLGGDVYDTLSRRISRDAVAEQNNKARLIRLVGALTHKTLNSVERGKDEALDSLHERLRSSFSPAIIKIFDNLQFLRPHFDATQEIDQFVTRSGDHVTATVWNKIFCGGEGLYSSFAELPDKDKARPYKAAISQLEQRFLRERAKHFDAEASVVSQAYETFCSKASITGLLMAYGKFCETEANPLSDEVLDRFLAALNTVSQEHWLHILTRLKRRVVLSLTPKDWPAMRRLYLRVIQEAGEVTPFTEANIGLSPDWAVAASSVDERMKAWTTANPSVDELVTPPQEALLEWAATAVANVSEILNRCGLKPIYSNTFLHDSLKTHLEKKVEKLEHEWEQS